MPPPGACLNIMEARQKQRGYGTFANPERFLNQDYQQLKQHCVTRGVMYVDDMFPPDAVSIGEGILRPSDLCRVQWLRPMKLSPFPNFILDGISRFDVGQGVLGDCWFLASLAALTLQPQIFEKVVPVDQTFDAKYCGLFHFRFWRFGKWVDVVIDDKLPTIDGRLLFAHSKDQNEFWPALMEKAYAKVCGSYTDMVTGTPAEAMMDFTGGVHISVELSDPPPNLWQLMCSAGQSSSLMGCGTPQGETPDNNILANGLVQGHAYTVTGMKQVASRGKPVKLLRLMNPWGKGEWTGAWSDLSPLWKTLSVEDRAALLSVADNGEFWLTLEDFCKFYTDLDICSLSPNFLDGNFSRQWETTVYEGRWVAGTTAGGCSNNRDSFWTNPQYRVKISGEHSGNEKNVLLSLMQKHDKRNRHLIQNFHIGISVFELKEHHKAQKGKFPPSFFNQAPAGQTKTYRNAREVVEYLTLKPAEYLIVPSTFRPNEAASFLLTIITKEKTDGYENSGDQGEEPVGMLTPTANVEEEKKRKTLFHQNSDIYEEVDAETLQMLLNEKILKGDLKSGGFSIEACRSMVALMDTSISGKLNGGEFVRLWKKVVTYRDIFFLTDVSRTGTLSLSELRNAFAASGMRMKDDMLSLMALRYGASSGHITLESFIGLILRLDCMSKIFKQLSDGKNMNLQESEWMYISMYT
uniref:calpain-1 catalytic subunit-like n=1 Tax=Gasterosteus aculeatus aculeatus TaxID=481459 RepID=UPI001A981633|nr:calpain-1 catalytic subunit-like [Gasterosteus aculeatus aculeatus]